MPALFYSNFLLLKIPPLLPSQTAATIHTGNNTVWSTIHIYVRRVMASSTVTSVILLNVKPQLRTQIIVWQKSQVSERGEGTKKEDGW